MTTSPLAMLVEAYLGVAVVVFLILTEHPGPKAGLIAPLEERHGRRVVMAAVGMIAVAWPILIAFAGEINGGKDD